MNNRKVIFSYSLKARLNFAMDVFKELFAVPVKAVLPRDL